MAAFMGYLTVVDTHSDEEPTQEEIVEVMHGNDYKPVNVESYELDLHSVYISFMKRFEKLNILWYNKTWARHFNSFEDFLAYSWPVVVVTDAWTGQAHIATQVSSANAFVKMIKTRYGEDLFALQIEPHRVTPFESGTKPLRHISNAQEYKKLYATLPAAVLSATKIRVRSGEPEAIRKLWQSKDKTFLAIDFEWFERDNSMCLEWGYCAIRCGDLQTSNSWPPEKQDDYWFGHCIVSEYVNKIQNRYRKTFPWNYAFGESRVVSKTMLPQIIRALISTLASPDSESAINTLVLVCHGVGGDLDRLKEMNIKLPHNMLILDTAVYERQLFNKGMRGDMNDAKSGNPRSNGSTLSLANMATSLDLKMNCKYHNSGNDAFMCLLSLQKLLEPDSVPKINWSKKGIWTN